MSAKTIGISIVVLACVVLFFYLNTRKTEPETDAMEEGMTDQQAAPADDRGNAAPPEGEEATEPAQQQQVVEEPPAQGGEQAGENAPAEQAGGEAQPAAQGEGNPEQPAAQGEGQPATGEGTQPAGE